MPSPLLTATSSPRKTGRRLAQLVFWAVVVVVSLAGAVQITSQVFFPPAATVPIPNCQVGLHALHAAVNRARLAAASALGEDAALDQFRSALEPEWSSRDFVAALCKGAATDEGALDAIERLRYAEEHAVRREAGELAPLRRRVQGIVDRELLPPRVPSNGPLPNGPPLKGPP